MWIQWLGTVVMLAVAGYAGLRLVVASRSSAHTHRASDATQVLMGLGMAAMLAPWGDPIPGVGGAALFGVMVVACVVAMLRERVTSQRLMWVQHAVMGFAIVYLFAATPMPMAMSSAHPAADSLGGVLPAAAVTWILIACSGCCAAWSALTTVGVKFQGAAEADTPAGWMLARQTTSLCEGVMAGSMAWMLLAMR
ncbi:MAG TPA: DUF5134 domain-containing protein [Candidatus Dormibacteraeota bacterium]|nr:DUF5134 domain-containing protein [Candidatus Dormibacteraeota bacterium]